MVFLNTSSTLHQSSQTIIQISGVRRRYNDASQEPLKLANEPITRNMARRYQAKLNLWAQEEVTRRIQDQSSMLMEDELKESTKFINILEVIMENREERPNFEIHLSLA